MKAILVLEDGHYYYGNLVGHNKSAIGEVVFNTSFTGYQEILTDPSYVGQIVVMTSPHIGNYGINFEDIESDKIKASGLVIRDYNYYPSNWRSKNNLENYLLNEKIPIITNVDTRSLVFHIRDIGTLRGIIAPYYDLKFKDLLSLIDKVKRTQSISGSDLVSNITTKNIKRIGNISSKYHVVCMDFGIKNNIINKLLNMNCYVTLVPATFNFKEILNLKPNGVLLSNGPGDPSPLKYAIDNIHELLGKVPIFGICLGHQLLNLACGGKTYKMKFGHRGANHPVRNIETGCVEITSQNHGFAVQASSINGREMFITHVNINDDTIEGLRHRKYPAFSVQFHPEASPGPHDSNYLFYNFLQLMERYR